VTDRRYRADVAEFPEPRVPEEASRHRIVLEVLEGCAASALQEAEPLGSAHVVSPTEVELSTDDLRRVRTLRRVVAAYDAITIPARRPRELLETSVQQMLARRIAEVRRVKPKQTFTGLRVRAAGADTPDMVRLADSLAEGASLPVDEHGDLVVRVRRSAAAPDAWEVLVRLTPRPLATRAWRTERYPGAVNATVAATVLDLLEVGAEDSLLDMTCGSGTLLIEQLHDVAPRRAVGVDLDPRALEIAELHQRQARRKGHIDWITGDVRDVPFAGTFTRIVSNPPWGTLLGDHETNEELLADLMARATEISARDARLGILTHEIERMHAVIPQATGEWRLLDEHMFFQKGHHPRLFLFERV
jgi:tRNA (guanine6-N2)-methyltransferase